MNTATTNRRQFATRISAVLAFLGLRSVAGAAAPQAESIAPAGIALFSTLDPKRHRLVMELIHGFSPANSKARHVAIAALPKGPDYKNCVCVQAQRIFSRPRCVRRFARRTPAGHDSPQRN
jgi:hypothetical protein